MSTVDAPLAGLYELLKSQLYAGAAALFFHGICLLLFSFAVFYLLQTRTPANRIFLILAVVLMLFALAQAILDVLIAAEMSKLVQGLFVSGHSTQALSLEQAWARMYIAREGLFAFNNAISDGILLYRCSVIWSTSQYHKYVLGGSSLLILATFILGMYATFLSPTDTPAPYILALLTNFVLLLLSAGRIWQKGRQAAVVLGLGPEQRRRYNGVVEIICESSLLYVLNVVIYLIADAVRKTAYQMPITALAWGALAQVVNIVPMMIMVRVGMAKSVSRSPSSTNPNSNSNSMPASNKSFYGGSSNNGGNGRFGVSLSMGALSTNTSTSGTRAGSGGVKYSPLEPV
ncbi:hypothetical protein C8R46DRAFT_1195550 [Mycena filopes]|nr:hypothetical protein C8R46DRAFT_1195550 [Mycena filopes]